MNTKHEYIAVPLKYANQMWVSLSLSQKIQYILQTIQDNEYSSDMGRSLGRSLGRCTNTWTRPQIETLHSFLASFPKSCMETWMYYEGRVPNMNALHYTYIRFEIWLEHYNELMERLDEIMDSFSLDYPKMRENGKAFYQELTKSVFCPQRISRVAAMYGLTWDEYLDSVDM